MTQPDVTAPGTTPSFRVLCVCEGNICRSPVAQLLLADVLGPAVQVSSAGTGAVVGAPVAPPMAALLRGRSVDGDAFRARQLQAVMLREADLVLTMTVAQRGQVVRLVPAVVRRTFTLRELARLLGDVDPTVLTDAVPDGTLVDRLRAALPAAARRRGYRADPGEDDVADPYGRADTAYRQAFDAVADAVDRIAERVHG